jgi:hypothetical protein
VLVFIFIPAEWQSKTLMPSHFLYPLWDGCVSQEQADLFKSAIANHRKLESIIREMRAISQEVLLKSAPRTRKKTRPVNHPKCSLT